MMSTLIYSLSLEVLEGKFTDRDVIKADLDHGKVVVSK